ncbi:hypothetical protein QC762_0092160 [Podospora pseudocomata]|uniref:Uncharacterized protein n=2 Tax=Podospora TaxID=5144 RepID=A0ABR0G6Z1_9PEZI|nr:hypothetical protein QC762_0092160 [Podospora pseudocomata]
MSDKRTTEKVGNTKWGNEPHEALAVGLYNVLIAQGVSLANSKDIVVDTMARMGSPFTWEAIRSRVESRSSLASAITWKFCLFATPHTHNTIPTPTPIADMVRWDNQSNSDLLTCLYDVYSKEMGREVQAQIVDKMKSKGHEDVNWDKIRL